MYHCCIRIFFIGQPCRAFEIIRQMTPLEHFSHIFSESVGPDSSQKAEADLLLVHLQDADAQEALQKAVSQKSGEARLILLTAQNPAIFTEDLLEEVDDIWKEPLSDEEIRFRFHRWQKSYKAAIDAWQTSQYLEATINSVPNLVWYKDKNGIHEKVNDSFCRTVKKTKEQIQGQGHAYIWDVECDDPACIASELEVMRKRETCISEETIQTGDGKRLLTTYKSPLYDVDGSVMGTVGVAIDITQERAYEHELMQKNRTLETIFTSLDCGVICHTLDGSRIIRINQSALDILGYQTEDDLIKDGFFMLAPSVIEEDRPAVIARIRDLKKEGDSASMEYRVRHEDGKILHVTGGFKLIRENGELVCQRFLLDCTLQKQQEQQERLESEQRQMALVQALSIDFCLVCVFDLDSEIGHALRMIDCPTGILYSIFSGELSLRVCMERYITSCVHPEDREMMLQSCMPEALKEYLQEKGVHHINYRTLCNGETRYFQMKIVRTGTWGEKHAVVFGFHNADDEIRSEMEKQGMLQDALSQANRASKAKSIFLSNMSHDIRTPMNAIMGFTTLAITHIDQKEQVEMYLQKILTSSNHLISLINDVLDMSRIESGKMHLDEALCRLPDILHGLRNIIQADIRSKQLDFYIDTVDILNEDIYCDKLRLNQVLLNLLSNSIKYTAAGGIVSMRITEKPGAAEGYANYEFSIKDTGIGMSQEFVEHIFEPFERERNSTISGIQGTGLGMAITKNIVDMMNGSIAVQSQQNVGTEFVLSLSFRLSAEPKKVQTIPQLKGCRALVVDDDFNTCDSVSYMLQQIGMRAEWTLSGREAVLRTHQAAMRNDRYSVYVIDWLMPDMNGIEVARRIRKELGEEVPIILLSAYDWADVEEEAKEAGVTAFCSKPLFLSELSNCLRSILVAEEQPFKNPIKIPNLHTGRILLTEDNELNQEIAQAILEEAGFTIEIAENGRIAVNMVKESQPGYYDLILMDVQMPEMDGFTATQAIRALENKDLAKIPILAMTANAFEEDKQAALQSGMNGHIAKPIRVEKLFEALDMILQ